MFYQWWEKSLICITPGFEINEVAQSELPVNEKGEKACGPPKDAGSREDVPVIFPSRKE
jgi:hypothetical protein